MKINSAVVNDAAEYVSAYTQKHLNDCFLYHNLLHTSYVVTAAAKLCAVMGIGVKEKSILLTAAWFHGLGFPVQIDGHEQAGAALAEDFLLAKGIAGEEIALVKAAFLPPPIRKSQSHECRNFCVTPTCFTWAMRVFSPCWSSFGKNGS